MILDDRGATKVLRDCYRVLHSAEREARGGKGVAGRALSVRGKGTCCVRFQVTRVAKLQGYMSKCVDGLNVKREGCRMCVRT